jgi:hypothetical protein
MESLAATLATLAAVTVEAVVTVGSSLDVTFL